ncbi:MAG: hypothetical protein CVV35_03425 [Methanomicrobiales archaeon HGW-Methanomicrobiales-6]|nr:MAG: hypothetical protein CVV35_03425 [Methanomicrobiales archaeon HGW-Methanomicrobiales-6]
MAGLLSDDRIEIYRPQFRCSGVNPTDGGDSPEDLDALIDAALEFLHVCPCIPRERAEEQVGIEIRDVLGVPDIVGQDIEIQVRLVPCLFEIPALPDEVFGERLQFPVGGHKTGIGLGQFGGPPLDPVLEFIIRIAHRLFGLLAFGQIQGNQGEDLDPVHR